MTSFQFGIDERNLTVSLMVHRIRDRLQRALLEEKQEQKFTQAQLARKLGVDRSVINRQLSGRENISVKRLAEFAWALGREIRFELPKQLPMEGTIYHPQSRRSPHLRKPRPQRPQQLGVIPVVCKLAS